MNTEIKGEIPRHHCGFKHVLLKSFTSRDGFPKLIRERFANLRMTGFVNRIRTSVALNNVCDFVNQVVQTIWIPTIHVEQITFDATNAIFQRERWIHCPWLIVLQEAIEIFVMLSKRQPGMNTSNMS